METAAACITGLRKQYAGRAVLDGLDLTLRRREFTALLGPSGTGKSTLLRILQGLETPDAGTVRVPPRVTSVFQEPRLVLSLRVLGNVTLGLPRTAPHRAAAREALAEVGLAGRERDWPATLSGGEAQRVALARALVRDPELLLLDEPFAALDALTRRRMHGTVAELVARHAPAVLMVTHDVDEAIALADRILVLRDGRLVADEVVDEAGDAGALRRRILGLLGADPAPGEPT
ncbi:ATP-binding cassette domain-containing protein [Microbacterium sp. MEC084]|nr:ABC transporter ATP-binding protein [Microbacterium sp. MEC084]MCD1269731.1 ATP-binding cassette domain-containing protein [Microbacterium sp. MEC084]